MESNFEWITANGDIGIRFFHSIDDGGYSNPPHWHNDLEIIYLLEGRLKVRFGDGGERQIGADELLVINSGTIHAVVGSEDFTLHAGDTLSFPGREPHTWDNPTDQPALVYWILAPAASR